MRITRVALPGVVVLSIAVAGCCDCPPATAHEDAALRQFLFEDPDADFWHTPGRNYSGGAVPDGNAYLNWLEGEIQILYTRVCALEDPPGPNCPDPDPTAPPPWPPQ